MSIINYVRSKNYTNNEITSVDQSITANSKDIEYGRIFNNLEDTIASWWVYPLAKRYVGIRDKTYLGYTDSEGYSGVASIDNNTGQISKKRLKKDQVDDHNPVAVDIMADGRIICAYSTGHFTDRYIHVRISKKTESIEEFGDDIVLTALQGNTTYSQLFNKNNKWFLFMRASAEKWGISKSDDGLNWTDPSTLIEADTQYYVKFRETTDPNYLRLVMYSNPNGTDTDIRLGFLDTTTFEVKTEDETVLGTTFVNKNNVPVIIPTQLNMNQRLLDVAITAHNKTVVGYVEYTDHTDGVYKVFVRDNGVDATYTLTNAGNAFYEYSQYYGGIAFKDENTLYLSRQDGATGSWFIEEWTFNGSVWSMASQIANTTGNVAIRPIFETDGDKVVWQEGNFNTTDFTDFLTDFKYSQV